MRSRARARRGAAPAGVAALLLLAGCGGGSGGGDDAGAAAPAPSAGTSSAAPSAGGAGDSLDVVASTDVWADVVKQVGGDDVDVTSFIDDPSQDPHSYEANARNRLTVSDADVVVVNGGGYDTFMDDLLGADPQATVIDAVDISGKQAAAGGELNEHVWYDLPTVEKVADAVAQRLGQLVPADADTFTANADAFGEELAGLEDTEAQVADSAGGAGVAITEPVPLYLLEAMGLENRTPEEFSEAVEEGTDVPPTALADTEALFTDGGVAALVYNEQTTGPQTEAVLTAAQDAEVPVVPVTETLPEGDDYVAWMSDNIDAIRAAVTG